MPDNSNDSKSKNRWHWEKENDVFGRIVWALILIGLGVLLLLNTTGALPWSFWGTFWSIAWRFWPLFLVFLGLQIIAGKNVILNLFSNIIFLLAVIGVTLIAVFTTLPESPFRESFNQFVSNLTEWRGDAKSEILEIKDDDYENVSMRNIDINTTHGKFVLADNEENVDYFTLDADYYENRGVPKLESSFEDGELSIGLNTESRLGIFFDFFENNTLYNIEVGKPSIPTNLDIQFTSGEGNAEFRELQVETFDLKMTSGNFDLKFLEHSTPGEINARLTSGNLTIVLSKEVGARISYSKTTGSISVNGDDLDDRNGTFEFNQDAETIVDIDLNLTSGNIDIVFE